MSSHNHAFVRILKDDKAPRRPEGAGFLIAPDLVVTCAHVVAGALGLAQTFEDKPTQILFLDFPFEEKQPLQTATIEAWYPVSNEPRIGNIEDLALLRLAESLCIQPLALVALSDHFNRDVQLCGFPKMREEGMYLPAKLRERTGEGRVQIDTEQGRSCVSGGFSGSAVYDKQENGVVGIVVSIDKYGSDIPAYMIPADTILKAFPLLNRYSNTTLDIPDLPVRYFLRDQDIATLRTWIIASENLSDEIISSSIKIGLVGMGGLGKTVLATALARDDAIRSHFNECIFWVTVGKRKGPDLPTVDKEKGPDLPTCQRSLAQQVRRFFDIKDSEDDIENSQQWVAYLRKLFYDKKALLIIDDVWTDEDVSAFNVLSKQGRMIITTREESIIDHIGGRIYDVGTLEPRNKAEPPDEALGFLKKILKQDENSIQAKEIILPIQAEEIVKECGYLPLAINIIGAKIRRAIMHNDPMCWDDCLQLLKNGKLITSDTESLEYQYKYLYRALEVSIEDLDNKQKEGFFDFVVFAEDAFVPEQVLYLWWKTKGIDEVDTREICRALIDRSLLRHVVPNKVSIHGLLLDYIRDKQKAKGIQLAHMSLVKAYRDKCEGIWADSKDDEYLFQYLAMHLREANQEKELFELLVSSPDWLNKRADHSSGLTAYFADTRVALDCIEESIQPQDIRWLVLLYAARQAVRQRAEKYSDKDLNTLVLLGQTAKAFDYVHFRQDDVQEIDGTLKLVETCFNQMDNNDIQFDVDLIHTSIQRIISRAKSQKYKQHQDKIESLLSKFYARTKKIPDAILNTSKIISSQLKDDTFLDIAKVAISIGNIKAAFEITDEIKNPEKNNQALRDIAIAQISGEELNEAINLSKRIIVQEHKDYVIANVALAFTKNDQVEQALKCVRKMNLSQKKETLSDIANFLVENRNNNMALEVAKEITEPISRIQFLCSLVRKFYKAHDVKNTKLALHQAHETALNIPSKRIRIRIAEALELVAEASIQVMKIQVMEEDEPCKVIEEFKALITKSDQLEVLPFAIQRAYERNGDKCPSELWSDELNIRLSFLQLHLVESYCRNGNFEKAQELTKSINNEYVREYAICHIAGKLALSGRKNNALDWAKSAMDANKAFAEVAQGLAGNGDLVGGLEILNSIDSLVKYETLCNITLHYANNGQLEKAMQAMEHIFITDQQNYLVRIKCAEKSDLAFAAVAQELARNGDLKDGFEILDHINSLVKKNETLCNIAFHYSNTGDLERALQAVECISITEQREVLQSLTINFVKHHNLVYADKAFKKKLNFKIEEKHYVEVLTVLIKFFIREGSTNKIKKLIALKPNYYQVQTEITKLDIDIATIDIKEAKRVFGTLDLDEPKNKYLIIKLIEIHFSKLSHSVNDLDIDTIVICLLPVIVSVSPDEAQAQIYHFIANVLIDKNEIKMAEIALERGLKHFKKIEDGDMKIEDGTIIIKTHPLSPLFDSVKKKIEEIKAKESSLNAHVDRIQNLTKGSEALKDLIEHDGSILNRKGFICKIVLQLTRKRKPELAKSILKELKSYDNSDEEAYIIADTYLELGFFKEAFELVDGKPVNYLISLICKPNIFESNLLLDCLSTLSWTSSQMWQPIYNICKPEKLMGQNKEKNAFWQKISRFIPFSI